MSTHNQKILIVTTVISLMLGIFASDGLCREEKAGILQKIKTAYNNFRKKRDLQKAEAQPRTILPEAGAEKTALPETKLEKKEMTQDETLADLKESIGENDELFDIIPELKSEKDTGGKFHYTFNGIKLEELSKEDLGKLATRVRQTLVKLRTDRIERQLETVRRVQNIQRIPAPTQVQQPPRIPSQPSSPPKGPPAPPAPPSRR
jgi:hypothetical protein